MAPEPHYESDAWRGNGSPSIGEVVRALGRLEAKVSDVADNTSSMRNDIVRLQEQGVHRDEDIDKLAGSITWAWRTSASAVLTAVMTLLIGLITWLINR